MPEPSPYGDLVSHAKALWDVGLEPGRQVVSLGVAVALTVVAVDVVLVGRISLFFDLSFVALCLGLALLVRPRDFYMVALLPPGIMLAVFALLAFAEPASIADPGDGFVQSLVSGMVHHSPALVAGYLLCLGALLVRLRAARG